MEANTLLRCVAFLGMLVLSLADAPIPQDPVAGDIYQNSKISTLTCAKKCGISCAMSLFSPAKYVGCVGLCMTACKIDDKPKPPAGGAVQPAVEGELVQQTSDPTHVCTRNCVTSMSKVMTTNAKLTMGKDLPAPVKPADSGLQRYAEGYVDACFLTCSKNNKVF